MPMFSWHIDVLVSVKSCSNRGVCVAMLALSQMYHCTYPWPSSGTHLLMLGSQVSILGKCYVTQNFSTAYGTEQNP